MTKASDLSPPMREALDKAKTHGNGKLVRYPGGYWTFPGAEWAGSAPVWWAGTSTVQALVTRGQLEYTKQMHRRRHGSATFPIEATIKEQSA